MNRPQSNLAGAALGLSGMALFACYDVSIKFLGGGYNALQILFFATLMGIPVVFAYALWSRDQGSLKPRFPGWMALRTAGIILNGIFGTYAFATLPLAQCYAIFFTMPIFIALFAVPILGERIDSVRGAAVLVGLLGVIVALNPGASPLVPAHGAALLAAVLGSLNYIILRKTGGQERSVVLLIYPMLATLAVVAVALPFVYVPMPLHDLSLTAAMALFAFVGYLLIIEAYRRARAIVVAPMQYSQILWAALFGALLFDEVPTLATLAGSALIIASGLVIVARQDAPRVSDPA
jgi:S-adenosylmethionine uptake transporter